MTRGAARLTFTVFPISVFIRGLAEPVIEPDIISDKIRLEVYLNI